MEQTFLRVLGTDLANENCDRAMMQLRAAQDRTNQLEAEVALFRDRAARAEGWLQTIHKQTEEKLIAPKSASGTERDFSPTVR